MKETMLMYAKYSKRADASVCALLQKLDAATLNKPGRTYYGSLGDAIKHVHGGVTYFKGLIRASVPKAEKFMPKRPDAYPEKAELTLEGLGALAKELEIEDAAVVDFVASLSEADLRAPIKLDWYGDARPTVPLHFMLNQLWIHGMHHRGQVSQCLDELKIEHDFSGLDLEFMPE